MEHDWRKFMPKRIAKLRLNGEGYPVPFFVGYVDDKPDFRVVDPLKLIQAVKFDLCFVCGEPMGRYRAFVIGPMCAINRISSEPPSHRDCAEFAARACPFLANPSRVRREENLPEHSWQAGIAIKRNPGVTLLWIVEKPGYTISRVPNGILFMLSNPSETLWYARGRAATRQECEASIDSGLPELAKAAAGDGLEAVASLARLHQEALKLLPAPPCSTCGGNGTISVPACGGDFAPGDCCTESIPCPDCKAKS